MSIEKILVFLLSIGIIALALFTRIEQGAAGTALTLFSIPSVIYVMFYAVELRDDIKDITYKRRYGKIK